MLVACSENEMEMQLSRIISDEDVLQIYANNAINCGLKNHHPDVIMETFYNVIEQVLKDGKKDGNIA